MMGTPDNDDPRCFWQADVEEAASDLAAIESDLNTTRVDVRDFLDHKRASMEAHASHSQDTRPLLDMAPEIFPEVVGHEWYIRRGAPAGHRDDDVFSDPPAEAR
jgi:LmbE family N-acetylglucosaminyl deacetylase